VKNENIPHYLLLWFLGLYLRLAVLIIPPLSLRLQEALGFSAGEVAASLTMPSLLIGGCALIGGWLIARFGAVRTVFAGLLIMALGSALRSIPEGFAVFMLATVVMGGGIALMQVGMPVLARAWVPSRVGRASAVWANGLLVGELAAAGLTGPLVTFVLGDYWLLAFTVWVAPVPLIAFALARRRRSEAAVPAAAAHVVQVSWHDPLLWRLALLMASAGALYYACNIFLPQILAQAGRADLVNVGLAALNGTQLFSSALLMVYADRLLGRRWPLLIALGVTVAMIPLLFWMPGAATVWAAGVFGFAVSAFFVIVLALPAWLVPVHQVPRLAAGVVAVGNVLAFVVPTLGGWLTDLTGSIAIGFTPPILLALVAMAASGNIRRRPGAAEL
jgi:MFS transporter, CP family, cyanate transporter